MVNALENPHFLKISKIQNLALKGSYFDGLLHEKHSNKQSKQFSSYSSKPIDDRTSSTYCQHKQHQSSPNTNPTHRFQTVFNTLITLISKKKKKKNSPSRPRQEQVSSQFRSGLCKVKHECVHNHSRLCNTENKQWLTSDNRMYHTANGCRC